MSGLVIPGETAMLLGGVLAFTGRASVVVGPVVIMVYDTPDNSCMRGHSADNPHVGRSCTRRLHPG